MGIIKKMKQLGEQIHGAKTGNLPVFDKDGNIIDSGRYAAYYLPAIGTSTRGKFMKVKDNSDQAEWVEGQLAPLYSQDDDGKVLTATGSGPVWKPAYEDITASCTTNPDLTYTYITVVRNNNMVTFSIFVKNESGASLSTPQLFKLPSTITTLSQTQYFVVGTVNINIGTNGAVERAGTMGDSATFYCTGTFIITAW